MSCYSLLSASALTACCFIACRGAPEEFSAAGGGGSSLEAGGASSVSTHGGRGGGAAGHISPTAAGDADEGGSGGDSMAAAAGDAGSTSGGTSSGGATLMPPDEIPADAGAGPVLTECSAQYATCAVLSQSACEFVAFAGATKTLNCGEVVAVGAIACGACGLITVKLYFDGQDCWEGASECLRPTAAVRLP